MVEVGLPQISPDEPSNIPSLFAVEVDHAPQSLCAKDVAPWNIFLMLMASDTSHLDRSELNAAAPSNINAMSVTLDTSHVDRSALNAAKLENILCILTTLDTSHFERSPLNEPALEKI